MGFLNIFFFFLYILETPNSIKLGTIKPLHSILLVYTIKCWMATATFSKRRKVWESQRYSCANLKVVEVAKLLWSVPLGFQLLLRNLFMPPHILRGPPSSLPLVSFTRCNYRVRPSVSCQGTHFSILTVVVFSTLYHIYFSVFLYFHFRISSVSPYLKIPF